MWKSRSALCDGASPSSSLDRRYLWGLGVDEILADEPVGGSTRWMLGDHQGTIRDLADGDGNLISFLRSAMECDRRA